MTDITRKLAIETEGTKMKSQEIGELRTALSAFQSEVNDPEKNKTAQFPTKKGGMVKFEYADLADLLQVVRPVLAKHGLSLNHHTEIRGEVLIVVGTLAHSSGQWESAEYPASSINADHKAIGAGITFARRYTGQALTGVSAETDRDAEDTQAVNVMSSAEAKRKDVWNTFLSDLEDCGTETALNRLVAYYEKNIYPTIKNSWRAQMDGEFDAKREVLSRPINKDPGDMTNAELDALAEQQDAKQEQSPLEAG